MQSRSGNPLADRHGGSVASANGGRSSRAGYIAAVVVDEPVFEGDVAVGSGDGIFQSEGASGEGINHVGVGRHGMAGERRADLRERNVIRTGVAGLDSYDFAFAR